MFPTLPTVQKKALWKLTRELAQKFTNALQKGMVYVQEHTPEEIAAVIQPQFAETDLETITAIVARYYEQDTWKDNLIFEKSSFDLLQDILEDAGELNERAPYEDLVTTEFAKKRPILFPDRAFPAPDVLQPSYCLPDFFFQVCIP